MGFIIVTAIKWQSPKRGDGLIPFNKREIGRDILISANRMSNIKRKTSPNSSNVLFDFTENLNDNTEKPTLVEVLDHWNEVTLALDTAYPSEFTILACFEDNDAGKSTYSCTIPTANISFAYADYRYPNYSWVIYVDGSRLKEVLCNSTLSDISAIDWLYDYDGNRYKYVQIGNQYWMIQNLRTTHYANGDEIPEITDDTEWLADTTGAFCWYDNSTKYKEKLGALYNWYAVNHASVLVYFEDEDGDQSLNWRVPTVADWDALVTEVGSDNTAGGILKERGIENWYDTVWGTLNNVGAVDSYGFRSKGCGNRHVDTEDLDVHGFTNIKIYNDMWTSEEQNATDAYSVYLSAFNNDFYDWNHEKYGGMAVRCCKDVT